MLATPARTGTQRPTRTREAGARLATRRAPVHPATSGPPRKPASPTCAVRAACGGRSNVSATGARPRWTAARMLRATLRRTRRETQAPTGRKMPPQMLRSTWPRTPRTTEGRRARARRSSTTRCDRTRVLVDASKSYGASSLCRSRWLHAFISARVFATEAHRYHATLPWRMHAARNRKALGSPGGGSGI